jgi:putative oxidoreductase
MNTLDKLAEFTSRSFLAAIFLISGLGKIGQYADTQGYMAAAGVPGQLLPLVIALEVAGALAIILGWQTRLTALALAGFCLLYFHGAGPWSLDARRNTA